MVSKFDGMLTKKHDVAAPPTPDVRPVGRPRNGKRSDETYRRLTVLVPEGDVTRMKRLLLDGGEVQNMSDYVAMALNRQLNSDERT